MKDFLRRLRGGARIREYIDIPDWQRNIHDRVRRMTMTGRDRIYATINATEYVVKHGVPGDIVECGVWRGGSMMAAALTLVHFGATDRTLQLFDTFEGMTPPDDRDRDYVGQGAEGKFRDYLRRGKGQRWSEAPLELVQANLASTGYPSDRIRFVPGAVEETIPKLAPTNIALLRLDTDWYESTRHELLHLYPRVSMHGVIMIDDYGHWQGARQAVDEFIASNNIRCLLHRIDYTGREFLKLQEADRDAD